MYYTACVIRPTNHSLNALSVFNASTTLLIEKRLSNIIMHVYFIFSILCNHMFTIFDPYLLLGGVTFNILNKKNHRNTLFPVKI